MSIYFAGSNSIVDLLVEYFKQFGDKPSCFWDLMPYVDLDLQHQAEAEKVRWHWHFSRLFRHLSFCISCSYLKSILLKTDFVVTHCGVTCTYSWCVLELAIVNGSQHGSVVLNISWTFSLLWSKSFRVTTSLRWPHFVN